MFRFSLKTVLRLVRAVLTIMLSFYGLALASYVVLRVLIGDNIWWLAWLNNFAPYYFLPLFISLPLALWLHLKRLSRLYFMLLVIAAIWLTPRFIHSNTLFTSDAAEALLSVITFNVWGDNQEVENVITWLRDVNADVVLLQEIPPIWAGEGIPELDNLYPYQISQSRMWGDMSLSRYPITSYEQYELRDGIAVQDRIEIEWNKQRVAIYNIHILMPLRDTPRFTLPINQPYLNMLLKYDDTNRNRQIDQLLTILETERNPFVVAGDFNMSDNTVKYGEVAAQLDDAFREAGFGIGATWPYNEIAGFPAFVPPLLRIDYIWHSDEFRAVRATTGPQLGSDHYPVVASLKLQLPD
ncbi:MAG: endonuclease/exonuclease/phosphatase family protein [Anaerolineae bacterium]|nr:endonuclease/exonuclease/phosphatase family protein [Anaerolineae bacterium]